MRIGNTLLIIGSTLVLLLILANIGLVTVNRTLQDQVMTRNQFIEQSLQLEKIYQPLVRTLAELATTRKDGQIKALLTEQGIRFNAAPAANAAPEAKVK